MENDEKYDEFKNSRMQNGLFRRAEIPLPYKRMVTIEYESNGEKLTHEEVVDYKPGFILGEKVMKNEPDGYQLIKIPGGEFMMGSPETEEGRYDDEGPVYKVKIRSFYMGKYPVTNEQYGVFLQQNPKISEPEYWGDRNFNQPNQPVVGVSWNEAKQYAKWAGLCLPTEAMWEYACRAGTTTAYYSGDTEEDLDRVGWYSENSDGKLHNVGEKEPNKFGLYDMHGNIWEWCSDWFDEYNKKGVSSNFRVSRGGGWNAFSGHVRSAMRNYFLPSTQYQFLGFRLCKTIEK